MKQTFLILDLANIYSRARHIVRGNLEEKVGMSIHTTLTSIRKAWRDFKGDHLVVCLEGRSWRKDFYKPYKANRAETRAAMTAKEQEEDRVFWETFDELKTLFQEKTNCTVLQNSQLEADDLIAGWIQNHPDDEHVIISTDSDFYQLLAPNVKQYNGVTEETHTLEGIFDKKGKLVIDKKTKEPKAIPNPEWLLFEKCMRGDTGDYVFSAYPGVRTVGTKNKVGLREAFADRHSKGWAWNNLMLQRWTDHDKKEHRVLDDYNRNVILIDLKAQPEKIRSVINETIQTEISKKKNIPQVGIRLLKFCSKYDLERISKEIQSYAEPLNSVYHK